MSTESIVALRNQNALSLALCKRWEQATGANPLAAIEDFREPNFRERISENGAMFLMIAPALALFGASCWVLANYTSLFTSMSNDQFGHFMMGVTIFVTVVVFGGLFAGTRFSRVYKYRDQFIHKAEKAGKLYEFSWSLSNLAKALGMPMEELAKLNDERLVALVHDKFVAACVKDREIEARQNRLSKDLLEEDRKEVREYLRTLYAALTWFNLELTYEEGFRLADEQLAAEKAAA